jgi:hypothetical protein
MMARVTKELDPYLKSKIGEAVIQIRELAKPSNLAGTQKVYYEGNWVKDIHNNYTEKQAQVIFDNVAQYMDKLDFFKRKLIIFTLRVLMINQYNHTSI